MAGRTPAQQQRYALITELMAKVLRIHNLVEQYALNRANSDDVLVPLARAFGRLKIEFTGASLDAMANLCGSMEIAARRGLGRQMKVRVLREAVGSLRMQLEVEQRAILAESKKNEAEQQTQREEAEG